MSDLSKLPPLEREARYRELAMMARELAASAPDADVRDAYESIAEHWDKLADHSHMLAGKKPNRRAHPQ